MPGLRWGVVSVGAAVLSLSAGPVMLTLSTPASPAPRAGLAAWAVAAPPAVTLTWSTSVSPSPGAGIAGLWARSASDVWAVGLRSGGPCQYQTLTQHWDGSSWTVVPSPDRPGVNNALGEVSGSATDDVWAVGDTSCPSVQTGRTLILHWNGRRWSLATSPNPGFFPTLIGVMARTTTDAWAVSDQVVSGADVALIEHWDGTAWRVSPGPTGSGATGPLAGVSAGRADDAWAVGSRPLAGLDGPLALHWDGATWTSVPVPTPGRGNGSLTGVVALPNGRAIAVGAWRPNGASSHPLIEEWTGRAWRVVTIPPIAGFAGLSALASAPNQVAWAVGFAVSQVSSQPDLLHRSGGSWSLVDPPPIVSPSGLAVATDGEVWTAERSVVAHGVPT